MTIFEAFAARRGRRLPVITFWAPGHQDLSCPRLMSRVGNSLAVVP
ncbi:MAG: hypothetical protein MUP25_01085 [Syntrophales bacterium]|nr:hypothetical protein [Syntrophales bacterium]